MKIILFDQFKLASIKDFQPFLAAKGANLVIRYGNAQEGTGAHKFLHEAIEVKIVGGFDGKADNRAVLFYIFGHVDVALHETCGCNLLLNAVDVGIYS